MDNADIEELRTLRARAYGPAPDIANDAAAVRRLAELETAARAARPRSATVNRDAAASATTSSTAAAAAAAATAAASVVPPGPPPPSPGRDASASPTAPAAPASPGSPMSQPTPLAEPIVVATDGAADCAQPNSAGAQAAPRRWLLSRGFAVLWGASLVAVAGVAAGLAFAATWVMPIAVHTDARQIATLTPVQGFEWPSQLLGNAGKNGNGYEFHGLTVISTETDIFSGHTDRTCLVAVPSASLHSDSAGITGPLVYGCGAGTFPATAQTVVTKEMPQELRDVVPVGSALQFILDGDRVGVYSDAKQ
jgi:hypothetical protein